MYCMRRGCGLISGSFPAIALHGLNKKMEILWKAIRNAAARYKTDSPPVMLQTCPLIRDFQFDLFVRLNDKLSWWWANVSTKHA